MAEIISSTCSKEISVKSNVVDMNPNSLLAHNSLTNINCKSSIRNLKDLSDANNGNLESTEPTNYSKTDVNSNDFSGNSSSSTTFRCERCDNFETCSRAALLLHVVQCLSSQACQRIDDHELDNKTAAVIDVQQRITNSNVVGNNDTATQNTSASSASSSSSTTNSSATSSTRKVFECDVCNMKFSNGANMRRHKMRHTGVKPYECRVCQKRFFRKDHLAEHFTTHTKTLPYHCPICNRGFQRQIAMRAHFQNEHVGQHDLVKTCPLCSYRAGSMKSLRIHFFNRHGIDLDNPGACGTSSLLLALETQASHVAAAAAAASFVPNLTNVASAVVAASNASTTGLQHQSQQSDSSESIRSIENSTPPMHFLTPHVEISTDNLAETALNDNANDDEILSQYDSNVLLECNVKSQINPASSNNNENSAKAHLHDNHIAPSISLIPIKQEIIREEHTNEQGKNTDDNGSHMNDNEYSNNSSSTLSSLIKVSPLKSLLREDLKRRICAKANNRMSRNAANSENSNIISVGSNTQGSSICNSTPICNGTITSTGLETDSISLVNRKQILTCLFCGIDFPDETLYFLHKGCHCESNPWKCNICSEQLNNVYEFNSHLLSKSHQ